MSTQTIEQEQIPSEHVDRSEDSEHYEIVDGERVELPPMSVHSTLIANRLCFELSIHGREQHSGIALMEILFRLPVDERNRRPDVAFVSYDRWPAGQPIPPRANAWDVVPDLAVEIVSPTDFAEDVILKMEEYFRNGVRGVWIIYPNAGKIYSYEGPTAVTVLDRAGELDGGEVLPGFRFPIKDIFPPVEGD